jgi:dienelactone hydrolase
MAQRKFKSGEAGLVMYKSANPFEFYHILNKMDDVPDQDVFGSLIFPEKCIFPCPLVICIHGSYGWRGHHHEHMVNLLNKGIAIFRIHSFEARGIISIVEDQMSVTLATMITDAFRALTLLQNHPDIDHSRIGITGWSLGGSTSFYSAWEPIIESLSQNGERFNAHLPLYPGLHIKPEDNRWTNAPISILSGADDDYTPPDLIISLVNEVKKTKKNIDITLYPNSHHSFDSIEPVQFIPNAIKLKKNSFINIDKEGRSSFIDENNNTFEVDSPQNRQHFIDETADIRGAHAGGNWETRRQSFLDVVSFFQKHFLS